MAQIGSNHTKMDLDNAFMQIVDTLDQAKHRMEAVQQWAATQTAAALATTWNIPVADAQQYIDACNTFGNAINNALTADVKLGPLVASIRDVGR